MNTTLAYLRTRRAWLVRNVAVWGSEYQQDVFLGACEFIDAQKRIGLIRAQLGGPRQEILFTDLVDVQGNHLPETIAGPAIVMIPRSRAGAFVKSVQGVSGFTVARTETGSDTALIDLLIFETGA